MPKATLRRDTLRQLAALLEDSIPVVVRGKVVGALLLNRQRVASAHPALAEYLWSGDGTDRRLPASIGDCLLRVAQDRDLSHLPDDALLMLAERGSATRLLVYPSVRARLSDWRRARLANEINRFLKGVRKELSSPGGRPPGPSVQALLREPEQMAADKWIRPVFLRASRTFREWEREMFVRSALPTLVESFLRGVAATHPVTAQDRRRVHAAILRGGTLSPRRIDGRSRDRWARCLTALTLNLPDTLVTRLTRTVK